MNPPSPPRLYRILTRDEWSRAQAAGQIPGSALDQADGFIHLSTATQVQETVRTHFEGADDILIAVLDPGALEDAIQWERVPSRDDVFPHLFRESIPLDAVVKVLDRDAPL